MYFVSINAGAQVAIIFLACGPCVVIVNCWDRFCTLGRAPHTKETLSDFHEWCRVTRHPRVFRVLTGCQRTPGFGASQPKWRIKEREKHTYLLRIYYGIHEYHYMEFFLI